MYLQPPLSPETCPLSQSLFSARLRRRERQESDVSRALDRQREPALMPGASADLATCFDLAPLGQIAAEHIALLVVNILDLGGAERTYLGRPRSGKAPAPGSSLGAVRTTSRGIGRRGGGRRGGWILIIISHFSDSIS